MIVEIGDTVIVSEHFLDAPLQCRTQIVVDADDTEFKLAMTCGCGQEETWWRHYAVEAVR